MKKIETIWHHILCEALKGSYKHTQKNLADKYRFSLSTVNHALGVPSRIGAVRKTSKFFILEDFDKLLYYWASIRNLEGDIVYQTRYPGPILKAEGEIPAESVYAGYSAARILLKKPPADYDKLYCYAENIYEFKDRFPPNRGQNPNLFVIKKTGHIKGPTTTFPQTFVDIWNMRDWYAKNFTTGLEEKMHGILS